MLTVQCNSLSLTQSKSITMAELELSGTPIDLDVNDDGDLAVLTETKVFVISLPRSRTSSMPSKINLPALNDFFLGENSSIELPFVIGKRVWWLPSTASCDNILLLTSSLHWLMYRRFHGSLQWTRVGQFCSELDKYLKNYDGMGCNRFIDMVLLKPPISADSSPDVTEFLKPSAETSVLHSQFIIDNNSMPSKYYLGTQAIQYKNFTKKKKKRKTQAKVKEEYIIPAEHLIPDVSNQKQELDKPVVKQLTKVSSTGEKRLVTYIMDGKQREEQIEQDTKEEKVLCVCGANEENSSEDEEWVECELCHTWQHVDCVAYFPEVQDYFHCDNCLRAGAKKQSRLKKKTHKTGRPRGRPPKVKIVTETNQKTDAAKVTITNELSKKTNAASQENSSRIRTLLNPVEPISVKTISKNSTTKKVIEKDLSETTIKKGKGLPNKAPKQHVEQNVPSDNNEDCNDKDSDSSYGIIHRGNHINCPCGASESESGEEWVQCDQCDKWQHQLCVNYADEDKTHYRCPSCKQILTFFATQKYAPITADSLAARRAAPSMVKGKFRIPKLSDKEKDDGFEIVGSSNCNSSFLKTQIQPVYIPKSLEEAYIVGALKSALECTGNETNSSQRTTNSSNSNTSNQNILSSSLSNWDINETLANIRLTNGTNVVGETSADQPHQNGNYIDSYAIVLLIDSLIVLRGSPESQYEISSLYSFGNKEMSLMSVFSNPENTEHHVAMVDSNTDNILLWKLSYCNSSANTFSKSVRSLPTLVLTEETVLSPRKCSIDRIMWLNQSLLLIYSMQEISCYDTVSSQISWSTQVKLDFVIDWALQKDKKLVVLDNVGSSIVIDTNNGSILQHNKCDQKDYNLVNCRISPSNLLRFNLRIPINPCLQYNIPCKVNVSANEFYSVQTHHGNLTSRERNFLQMNVQPLPQERTDIGSERTEGLCCPICNCTEITRSNVPFELTCINGHILFLDPEKKVIIDPFSGIECPNCGVLNLETAVKCGSCNQEFIC